MNARIFIIICYVLLAILLSFFGYIIYLATSAPPRPPALFEVNSIVQTVTDPTARYHVVDTSYSARFISEAYRGQHAYKVRLPSGKLVWMAEAELRRADQ